MLKSINIKKEKYMLKLRQLLNRAQLTLEEVHILRGIARGQGNKEIARSLDAGVRSTWDTARQGQRLRDARRAVVQGGGGGGARDLHLVEQISKNMGHSFLAGVQALAPTIAGAARQGGGTKDDHEVGGRLYSENNVAALKGYCGVVSPADIP